MDDQCAVEARDDVERLRREVAALRAENALLRREGAASRPGAGRAGTAVRQVLDAAEHARRQAA